MPNIKLARLPDRTPVKLGVSVSPDLHEALADYAALYAAAYGQEKPIVELVPAMLETFLESDREFAKARKSRRTS